MRSSCHSPCPFSSFLPLLLPASTASLPHTFRHSQSQSHTMTRRKVATVKRHFWLRTCTVRSYACILIHFHFVGGVGDGVSRMRYENVTELVKDFCRTIQTPYAVVVTESQAMPCNVIDMRQANTQTHTHKHIHTGTQWLCTSRLYANQL